METETVLEWLCFADADFDSALILELLRNFNFARASAENAVLQASGWQNGRPLVKLMEFRKRSNVP